ncbi:MAG: hypothetical protein ACLUIQ_05355 [Dialister invisus]
MVALVAADDRDELVGISEQGITIRIPADQISSKKAKEDRASSSSVWKRRPDRFHRCGFRTGRR